MEAKMDSGSTMECEVTVQHEYSLFRKSVLFILTIQEGCLTWTRADLISRHAAKTNRDEPKGKSLSARHILSAYAETVTRASKSCHRKENEKEQGLLNVHFIEQLPEKKMKVKKVTFDGPHHICQRCAETIQHHIKYYAPNRPKNLLVFINPQSGNKSGEKTYRRKVAPLFSLSGIQTQVIVTERENHSRDVLKTADLRGIDGIVCVGGDGTLSEVANSYLQRCYQDDHTDLHNPETVLPRPNIPIGVIPTGSGDTIVRFVHETRSVTTAAIHIILGKTRGLDFGSVHHNDELICYTCLLVGYGLYGRLIEAIEIRRWLPGKIRYSVIPLLELLKVQSFPVKVEMLVPCKHKKSSIQQQSEIEENIKEKSSEDSELSPMLHTTDRFEWCGFEGPLLGVDSFIVQLMPVGISMRPYIGNGLAQLTLVKNCPRLRHLRHLMKLMHRSPGFYDYDFIEEHWVKGYRVEAIRTNQERGIEEMYLMNCDGDLTKLDRPRFEVRVHKELIKLFTWIEED